MPTGPLEDGNLTAGPRQPAGRESPGAGVQPPTDPSRSTSIRRSSGLGQPAARGEDAAWTPPREAARPDERSFVEGGIRSSALRLSCRLAPTRTWRLVQRWAPLRLPGRRRELEASVVRQSPGLHFGARVRGEVNWALSKGLRLRVRPSAGKVLTLTIGQGLRLSATRAPPPESRNKSQSAVGWPALCTKCQCGECH